MRDVLFRGQREDGEWLTGSLVRDEDGRCWIFYDEGCFPVRAESVGQWSGMRDHAGMPIFEGDAVLAELTWSPTRQPFSWGVMTCVFDHGSFCLEKDNHRIPLNAFAPTVQFTVTGKE